MTDKIKTAMNYIIGISSIAIILLVILIIFGNLSGNTGITTTKTISYVNETGFVNNTGYTPVGVSVDGFMSYTILQIGGNFSGDYYVIPASNYTKSGNKIINGTTLEFADYGYTDAGITYTATYRSGEYLQTEAVISNMSSGVGKLTTQFPTIFLFVGIGLLIFVLIGVLVWVIRSLANVGSGTSKLGLKGNIA